MTAYTIDFKASVEKDLRKVPKDRLPDILEKIEELAEAPLTVDSKKLSCFPSSQYIQAHPSYILIKYDHYDLENIFEYSLLSSFAVYSVT